MIPKKPAPDSIRGGVPVFGKDHARVKWEAGLIGPDTDGSRRERPNKQVTKAWEKK
jgi:hypothetical protein